MSLEELRKEIDSIDDEIIRLLNKRMEIVKKVGELKNTTNAPIYRPEREKEIIKRLTKISKEEGGILSEEEISAIFLEIFAISRALERKERIAYLGPAGTYTHQAAESRFGAVARYVSIMNIEGVFKEVASKEAKYGVVPIENNTEGVVGITLDSLKKYDVKIVAEICMDIHHSFASLANSLEEIKRIYSHPQGYHQCLNFLETHNLLNVEFIPTESTAKAAELASKDKHSGAICSKIAANLYKVPLMFEKIEDNKANRTRFIIISDFKVNKSGND
jgi:chorismate mutase/prephenate dehydratase